MIVWWGGYLWSNWPILKENNDRLPLAISTNLKAVFRAIISQYSTLRITDWASDLDYYSVFANRKSVADWIHIVIARSLLLNGNPYY